MLLILKFFNEKAHKCGLYVMKNLGGERSRLWLLRQGKRAEEARMISLTTKPVQKTSADENRHDHALAA